MNRFARLQCVIALVLVAAVNFSYGEPPKQDPATDKSGPALAEQKPGSGQPATQQPAKPAANGEVPARIGGHGGPIKQKVAPQPTTPTVVLKPGEIPGVKFDTPTFNFGRVRSGSDVVHDFWFTNTGNGPLELLSVRPSCGCTTSGQYDRVVQPGESGKIPIKLNTGHGAGPMTKSIAVQTNAPGDGATVSLQLTGTLWQVVQAVPTNVNYSSLRGSGLTEADLTKKVVITNNGDTPMKPSEPKLTGGPFKVELKTLKEGKEYELTVVAQQPLSKGSTTGTVQIATGNAEVPMLNIPISIYIMSDIEISPAQVSIPPAATLLKPMDRMFYVRNHTNSPAKILDITMTNPEVKAQITELQTGSAWRLTLTLPAQYTAAPNERMVLKTDNPSVPELIVPFMQSSPNLAAGLPATRPPAAGAMNATNAAKE